MNLKVDKRSVAYNFVGENEALIIYLPEKKFYILKDVGCDIWKCLCDNMGLEEIIGTIEDKYDVDADKAELDTKEFINSLKKNSLLL